MDNKLEVKIFRFNPKTDYLPYYKQYNVSYEENETVLELLKKLQKVENFNIDGVENSGVKINNLFVNIQTLVKKITEKTSNELIIEPVSTYRSILDLSINTSDFFDKLALFDQFLNEEEKSNYAKELQLYYYASNTLNFKKEYIGDHMLIIASELIQRQAHNKDAIINILANKENGIWYHTALDKRILDIDTNKVTAMNKLLNQITKKDLSKKEEFVDPVSNVAQDFNDFNIAVYDKDDTAALQKIVIDSKAKLIDTLSKNDDLALHSMDADKNFTFKVAGQMLLDALDNNADFIIVKEKENLMLLDNKQKEISKAVGRDIDLPIVTAEQFHSMLKGEKDQAKLGFNKHKVSIPFL